MIYFEINPTAGVSASQNWQIGFCPYDTVNVDAPVSALIRFDFASLDFGGGGAGSVVIGCANNDVIGVALDCDADKAWVRRNGVWYGGGDPDAGTSPTVSGWFAGLGSKPLKPVVTQGGGGTVSYSANVNFGQHPFAHAKPTRAKTLSTAHLPTKTPKDLGAQIGAALYTGTGAAQNIDVGFQPDFVWIKRREYSADHRLYDAVRGAGKQLYSNSTSQENTSSAGLTAFTSSGFSLGTPGGDTAENASGGTYIAWCIGGLTHMTAPDIAALVAATEATITPSAIAYDATLGMAIIKVPAGTSLSSKTLPNALGKTAGLVVVKQTSGSGDWYVGSSLIGTDELRLNSTAGRAANEFFPSNTATLVGLNIPLTGEWVIYLFANTDAIKVGSYAGNGSADGPFVDLGGVPMWVMGKRTDAAGYDWHIHDDTRSPLNPVDKYLAANANTAENVATTFDFCASGFKLRTDAPSRNAASGTYIYLAFIDRYFGGANVAQGRAR